jgi:G3E family GTPase
MAIDSGTLLSSIVQGNRTPGVTSACILADQIECSDVIVLNGEPAADDCTLARAVALAFNSRARVVQRTHGATLPKLLDAEVSFDFEAAFAGAGWRKLMEEEEGPRRNDQGVTTFTYRARRPLHPEKFWNLIQSPFPGVFRAKGFFWLATRMSIVGGLNLAGAECHYSPAGQWWAATARGNPDHAEIPERLKKEWAEPFGDRRQAIAFIGIDINPADLSEQLDACLLSESEMTSGEHGWAMLPDPFPAWTAKTHDHECEEHDCCHH